MDPTRSLNLKTRLSVPPNDLDAGLRVWVGSRLKLRLRFCRWSWSYGLLRWFLFRLSSRFFFWRSKIWPWLLLRSWTFSCDCARSWLRLWLVLFFWFKLRSKLPVEEKLVFKRPPKSKLRSFEMFRLSAFLACFRLGFLSGSRAWRSFARLRWSFCPFDASKTLNKCQNLKPFYEMLTFS